MFSRLAQLTCRTIDRLFPGLTGTGVLSCHGGTDVNARIEQWIRPAVIRANITCAGAVAVIAYRDTDEQVVLDVVRQNRRRDARGDEARRATLIDAVTRLCTDLDTAPGHRVWIDDAQLRTVLAAESAALPHVAFTDTPDAELGIAAARALSRIGQGLPPVPTPAAAGQPGVRGGSSHLVLATDASVASTGEVGAGIAIAGSDGRRRSLYLSQTKDVTWAELQAIEEALICSAGEHRVVILSDSSHAVDYARGDVEAPQTRMRRAAARIAELREGRDVNIMWVRAHRGHELNEAADQLAKKARLRRRGHDVPATTHTPAAQPTPAAA
ncbi:ribonuclease H family protein [Kocuria sp. CPCC 205268]|uniref:ribonuclease H family protein n=1 Tax=Kocuria oxytropis TaxID=3058913 RepID=UPI0034D5F583